MDGQHHLLEKEVHETEFKEEGLVLIIDNINLMKVLSTFSC